jgi:hypothetical protein
MFLMLVLTVAFADAPSTTETVPAQQLVVTSATQLSPLEIKQVEAQSGGDPLVLGGHGLMIAVRAPANVTMVTPAGNLVITRTSGARAVLRATVDVGTAVATKDPAPLSTTSPLKYGTGPNGPTIALESQVTGLDQALASVKPSPKPSGNWRVMAAGPVSFDLQPGTTLMTVPPGGEKQFVVALGTSVDDQAWLYGPFKAGAKLGQLLFEGASEVGRGKLGSVQWLDLRYSQGGAKWRQRLYLVPYGTQSILILKTDTHEASAEAMFKVADEMVRTYSSGVSGP